MSNWPTVPLGEALEFAYGKSLPKSKRSNEGAIPVYGSNGITGWHCDALVNGPTVIVGRKGSAGAVQYVEGPCYPIDTTYFVRPREGFTFDTRFIFYLLRCLGLSRLRTATGVPGLTREDAYRERIPVPSMTDQRRIVDLLSRAEGIVRLRREAQQKAAELIPAIFIDMFGDPATNPRRWSTRRMVDICTLVRGSSPRPQGDPKFFGGPVPRLMIADITRDGVYVTPTIDSLTLEGAKKSRPMAAGDVVMAVSGAVGLPAILAIDACIHDGFVGFRALDDAITSDYLYSFLNAYRRHSESQAVGVTFQNLKTDQIKEWLVPIPPLAAQHRFQQMASELRGLSRQQSHATATAVTTFQSLLHRTFQAG